jgi:hypothetical protein
VKPPVSYQSMLDEQPLGRGEEGTFARLPDTAITTRRKDAGREVTVSLSKAQARWLKDVEAISGRGIDRSAVVRALVDLGAELDVDWAVLAGGTSLRAAVREAVRVRRPDPGPGGGEG